MFISFRPWKWSVNASLVIATLSLTLVAANAAKLAGCLPDPLAQKLPTLLSGEVPEQSVVYPGIQWETATPQEVVMDAVKFAAAMDALPSPAVVIRNGKIVGSKGDISRVGFIWSASKSLTALIVGRLMQQGVITYDTLVPGSDVPAGPLASYRHFMSMTSDFNLSPHSPGGHYAYNNGAIAHYGDYIKSTNFPGRDYVQILKEAYLNTTGFQDQVGFDGYASGWGGGWSMSTRDLARVGYLVLRSGNWAGAQVLPASFVNDLYHNQIPSTANESPDRRDSYYNQHPIGTPYLPGAYSFGFWLSHKGSLSFGRSSTEAIVMSGAYGTSVLISRATDLVIAAVNTSDDHQEGKIPASSLDLFASAINASATHVHAALYRSLALAPDSIVAAFGTELATTTATATSLPLPTLLGGTSVKAVDSAGTERPAQLLFVSPNQVNYVLPSGMANGLTTITITNGRGVVANGKANIDRISPGLFTADSSGRGLPTAQILRVSPGGQSYEPVARFDTAQQKWVAAPIDLGLPTDQVYLALYGTGIRNLNSQSAARVVIGGVDVPVLFVGAQGTFAGVDQVNALLPRSLAGRGDVDVRLTIVGQAANTVTLNIK